MAASLLVAANAVGCQFPRPADVPDKPDAQPMDAPENVMITAGPDNAATTGPFVSFSFAAVEGTPNCSFDGAPPLPCASPIERSLPAGIHTFTVQAEDSRGVVDREMRTWTVACAPRAPGANSLGLFHFDEPDGVQSLRNEIATTPSSDGWLGIDPGDTMADPMRTDAGRFGRGLMFLELMHEATVVPNREITTLDQHALSLWFLPQRPAAGSWGLAMAARSAPVFRFSYDLFYFRDLDLSSHVYWNISALDSEGTATYSEVIKVEVDPTRWHHVVVSYAPGTVATLWVDGSPHDAAQPTMFTGSVNPATLRVGRVLDRGPFTIDEVALESQPASLASIRAEWCPVVP